MLIRFELLNPTKEAFNANNYLTIVGLHGTMMMGMMTSGILGPFANYLVPIMIGARRMAFPRIEALTFWLLMLAGIILMTTVGYGGFPTGWTGYTPLNVQANMGMDSYIVFFALVGVSMSLLGLNILATVITMRAPGMTWSRLPIFVWGVISTAILMLLAAPVLISTLFMVALDRTAQTGFFNDQAGGSPYLYQNLFWIFGHPEVYILALPGMGIVLEILPVFTRKPLWGYRLAVTGMLGITLLSWLVWQHHLFVSGINADLRPFYMLSTELISLPTGFIFHLCARNALAGPHPADGADVVHPRVALQLPDRRVVGRVPLGRPERCDNARQLLLDGSLPLHDHGWPALLVLRCNLFLGTEDDGTASMSGAKVHFWSMFIAFNATFGPLLVIGFLGMPRRSVTYAGYLHGGNTWVSISAFFLGASMLVFIGNFIWSQVFARVPAGANPWGSKSIEWQLPSPVPVHNFDRIPTFGPDPYPYGVEGATGRIATVPARPTA